MSPDQARAWVAVLTRDILPPVSGTFMLIYGVITGALEPWWLPLIAGLFGVPLVAPRKDPE